MNKKINPNNQVALCYKCVYQKELKKYNFKLKGYKLINFQKKKVVSFQRNKLTLKL